MPAHVLTLTVLLAALASAAVAEEAAIPSAGDADIRAILVDVLRQQGVPALGAAVLRGHAAPLIAVAGWRKRGDRTPVTVEDRWHLGSCTKAMTATLAARLVVRGALSWQTSVAQSFPELGAAMAGGWGSTTIDALLMHRSGAPANLPWAGLADRRAAVRQATATAPIAPGTYAYSNAGYVLAGAMIERSGSGTWESLLAKEVWQPLGMVGGFGGMGTPGLVDQPWGHQADGRPAGNGPQADNPEVMGPAGRVHLSLADWSRFIADQVAGERGEPALLPTEAYHHLHQPWPLAAGAGTSEPRYACGWIVVERPWAHGRALTHEGTNTMHVAVAWLAPAIDLAILVVCNQGGTDAACDAVASRLVDRYAH